MTQRPQIGLRLVRTLRAVVAASLALCATGCATDGTSADVGFYGGLYYDDPWYWGGGCCVDPPADIGPPPVRPEHPIAMPPPARPEQPIAKPPSARPTPMPRAAAMPRGRR